MPRTMQEILKPPNEHQRYKQAVRECHEYLQQIQATLDANLAVYAAAALHDLILERRMGQGKLAPR